ncbi:MAG: hypothetical protein Edafosvirus1_33 [Edafosvirus sp.]|uniref:Uncharacterized protein n=1 Tax=Edafosvirus sp. TaxID=2487765 RepID=A0A3G4ZS07_9VIRU|nr:MAG: hypothetical protein Edafosvirus1_33 [Edafosvirus sp.]
MSHDDYMKEMREYCVRYHIYPKLVLLREETKILEKQIIFYEKTRMIINKIIKSENCNTCNEIKKELLYDEEMEKIITKIKSNVNQINEMEQDIKKLINL